ncbi:HAD family hydrolase [Rhodohalobacter halophilus]|uniref:HAD family hydrolase n=1 Tax=Rhodohalobacter halophilus TaxID=1812810 RepID=UPI00083F636A|nr:HAD-IA family hydrolase [Rhodohalobacter halophilus]
MKPSFVYFDLDNTLLNHISAERNAQEQTYKQYPELQEVSLDEWHDKYKAINHILWEKYQRDEIDRHALHKARFHQTMSEMNMDTGRSEEIGRFYMHSYRNFWTWVDGAQSVLERVSSKVQSGIITNGFKETQELKFEKLNLKAYCNPLLITEEIGKLKPHPIVFDVATEKAGVPREEILYVGDSFSSDIVGGKNAGWQTAWFTALIDKEESRNGYTDISADFEFEDFDELLSYLEL